MTRTRSASHGAARQDLDAVARFAHSEGDYDAAGNLVSLEVLDASSRVEEPRTVTLRATG